MAKGNRILVAGNARRIEGYINGTPKPGVMMQVHTTAPVGGRNYFTTYAPAAGDGAPRAPLILDIDGVQGKTADDAYVSGKRGFLWALVAGDEVNVRKADITGTGSATEDVTVGMRLLVVDGTGMISTVAVGIIASPVSYPFVALEAITDQPAEMLVYCMCTGY